MTTYKPKFTYRDTPRGRAKTNTKTGKTTYKTLFPAKKKKTKR